VDPYLAIASKRDERAYADTPIPADVRQRILDGGRLSGSSRNRQRWEFVVVSGGEKDRLAEAVYAPENVGSAALVVAMFPLGCYVPSGVYLAWMMRRHGGHGWVLSAAYGAAVMVAFFLIFDLWFRVPLAGLAIALALYCWAVFQAWLG